MKIGFAKKKITPRVPCVLAGYAPVREMEGVHDDLYVKALFFSAEGEVYGCVSYDLLAVDSLLMEPAAAFVEKNGVSRGHVLFCAIHTHSAPGGALETRKGCLRAERDIVGDINEALAEDIAAAAKECIAEALGNMQEGKAFSMYGTCSGVGSNRDDKDLEGNDALLCFEIWSGQEKMLLVNFACHPTVLHAENRLCSADFPGALQKKMETEGYCMTMFLNGSAGDISTRFTRKGSGFEEAGRYGELLGQSCLSLLEHKALYEIHKIKIGQKKLRLRAKEALPVSEARKMLDQRRQEYEEGVQKGVSPAGKRLLESLLEGAEADLRYAQHYSGQKEYNVELNFFRVNDDIFVAVPGELMSQLSNPLQDEQTHFISYANGYLMYFADRNAYRQGYYEALSSPFLEGEAERMIDLIEQEIQEWRNEKFYAMPLITGFSLCQGGGKQSPSGRQ